MNTDSSHLILDLWMEGEWDDQWVARASDIVEKSFTVVKKNSHQFVPHGETVAFILSESHYTLHSYPEENYISLDIYICRRDFDFLPFVQKLEEYLPITRIHHRNLRRGEYALPWLSRLKSSDKALAVATFVVAACSLFYELLLAQTLSAILGDTAHRYNVTIGLYIASMGIGALLYERLKIKNYRPALIRVELVLAFVGVLAPVFALVWDYLWRGGGAISAWVISGGLHFLIILIGLLSGLELPLLMDYGEKKREGFGTRILAVDYAGTLTAAILFPLVLLPTLSLFAIGGLIATINTVVAFLFLFFSIREKERISPLWIGFGCFVFVVSLTSLIGAEDLRTWIVETFYLGSRS